MEHLMIDLETLGTKPGSVFLSIAAVQFNIKTGATGKIFKENISLDSALEAGLTIDSATIKWWFTQRREIFMLMFDRPAHLHNVLVSFEDFIQENSIKHVWGNSPRFDLGILEAAFNKYNMPLPWKFYDELDFRTIKTLWPQFVLPVLINRAEDHDPLYDCEKQIKVLCYIMSQINSHLTKTIKR